PGHAPEPGLGAGLQRGCPALRGDGTGGTVAGGTRHGGLVAAGDAQCPARCARTGHEGGRMNILLVLIPVSVVLLALAIAAFAWAVRRGQFEQLDSAALDILGDDRRPHVVPSPDQVTAAVAGDAAAHAGVAQAATHAGAEQRAAQGGTVQRAIDARVAHAAAHSGAMQGAAYASGTLRGVPPSAGCD